MKILTALAALSLISCQPTSITQPPAPLNSTTIDEKTLIVALQTFDTTLTAVDRLIAAGVIKPGSPRALQIAEAIHKAKVAFQAASAAQRAGSATDYLSALTNAQVAMASINVLVKGS